MVALLQTRLRLDAEVDAGSGPIPSGERITRHATWSTEAGGVGGEDCDILERTTPLDGWWPKAAQPIKEFNQHFQSVLLAILHRIAQSDPLLLHIWVILELEVPPLERNRVVELELRGAFEDLRDGVQAEIPRKRGHDIGEHEGDVVGQNCGEDGGQNGERVVQAASTARDGAIDQEKNGRNGVQVILNLSRHTLPVEHGLLRTACVKQTRRVENANLG